MSPANNLWEAITPLFMAPLCRILALGYVLSWDAMCAKEVKAASSADKNKKKVQ